MTEGEHSDLVGDGAFEFTITRFLTFESNGIAVSFVGTPFLDPNDPVAPEIPANYSGYDRFTWDQAAQTVINRNTFEIRGSAQILDSYGGLDSNLISLSYPEAGGGYPEADEYVKLWGFSESPGSHYFIPIETRIEPLVPVPEPGKWAVIGVIGLLVLVGFRRI